jgi:hypothetical protein
MRRTEGCHCLGYKVSSVRGSVRRWPGVTKLKDWHEFPQWSAQPLAAKFPTLEPAGVDLMQQMFVYDPAKRITVSGVVIWLVDLH